MARSPHPVRSHLLPRSGAGWVATVAFLALMALAQPPIVHGFADRVEPWVLGMPFLYAWLLGVYVLMIGVLLWAQRKRL